MTESSKENAFTLAAQALGRVQKLVIDGERITKDISAIAKRAEAIPNAVEDAVRAQASTFTKSSNEIIDRYLSAATAIDVASRAAKDGIETSVARIQAGTSDSVAAMRVTTDELSQKVVGEIAAARTEITRDIVDRYRSVVDDVTSASQAASAGMGAAVSGLQAETIRTSTAFRTEADLLSKRVADEITVLRNDIATARLAFETASASASLQVNAAISSVTQVIGNHQQRIDLTIRWSQKVTRDYLEATKQLSATQQLVQRSQTETETVRGDLQIAANELIQLRQKTQKLMILMTSAIALVAVLSLTSIVLFLMSK
jgi:hypothetical protein